MPDCFRCAKHRSLETLPGGEIISDEHAVVSHLPLTTPARTVDAVYLGYLFVELRRHAAEWGDLTPDEAASVGRLAARASAALRDTEGAEHVYAAVIGHGVDHFHVHLIPRYPGTPREYWWVRVDSGRTRPGATTPRSTRWATASVPRSPDPGPRPTLVRGVDL
jgi:diadenosine tetraphosphate (Ap4A) HIT family hydrolase